MSVSKTKKYIICKTEFIFVFPNFIPKFWSEILKLQGQKKNIQIIDDYIITINQIFDTPIQ